MVASSAILALRDCWPGTCVADGSSDDDGCSEPSVADRYGVVDGQGVEVHVTRCWDQRELTVVNADGATVGQAKGDEGYAYPDYNLRQYTVLRTAGESTFRVFGVQTINGSCP